jgi:4-oxalmesaconate hydratase
MIIDCHGHVSAPAELWVYKSMLLSHRGEHGRRMPEISDEEILHYVNRQEMGPSGHLDMLDRVGTKLQLLSPRPFQTMHSEKPGYLVHWFTEETNNIIARQVKLLPDRFVGIAGLPQAAGEPVEGALPELERAVRTLGFKGCLLNPDPYENSGVEPPPLGDRYWYPLYE